MMPQKYLKPSLTFLLILFLGGCFLADIQPPDPMDGKCPWPLNRSVDPHAHSYKIFCRCLNKHKEVDIADYKETYKAFKCNRHIRQEANQTATGKAINHRQWLEKNKNSKTIQQGTDKAKQVKDRDAKPVIDTVWDIANLAYDGGKALYALAKDDKVLLDEALTDLATDAVATAIPGIPAGTTKIARQSAKKIKAGQKLSQRESKALEKVVEVRKKQKGIDRKPTNSQNPSHNYKPASKNPKNIIGIPDLKSAGKNKSSVQGGGHRRKRYKDSKGNIYEWDYRHGTLEKYNKRGEHLGEYDPKTGKQLKGKNKTRRIEP